MSVFNRFCRVMSGLHTDCMACDYARQNTLPTSLFKLALPQASHLQPDALVWVELIKWIGLVQLYTSANYSGRYKVLGIII